MYSWIKIGSVFFLNQKKKKKKKRKRKNKKEKRKKEWLCVRQAYKILGKKKWTIFTPIYIIGFKINK